MQAKSNWQFFSPLIRVLYIIFFISIFFSFRAITSISIGLILLLGMIENKAETGKIFNRGLKNFFVPGCFVFYLVQLIALFYTNNLPEGIRHLQTKSALIFIPMALWFNNYLNPDFRRRTMGYYIGILLIFQACCLTVALLKYLSSNGDTSFFFYHELVSPFEQHAIQVSILVFIAIIYLLESARGRSYFYSRVIHLLALLCFLFFIFLLSSKLLIACTIIYLLFYLINLTHGRPNNRPVVFVSVSLCILAFGFVLLTPNQVSRRFNEIITGNIRLVQEKSFHPGYYFNGLQFRLLQWRFVPEILNDKHAWIKGVSPGDARAVLDEKYKSVNMYIGEPSRKDHGFLGYNCHNQFLESMLQTGIIGLAVFLIICYGMIEMAIRKKNSELFAVVLVLAGYSFTESVFETQYGLTIFTFFPLFLFRTLPDLTGTSKEL